MHITAVAGGVGGARFLRGLLTYLERSPELTGSTVTIIGNTGDDITLYGLRVCPDIDTLLYTLGGGVDENQGWGRADETFTIQSELTRLGVPADWFRLGDQDFGTHVARSMWLGQGRTLSQVTAHLAARWGLPEHGVTLLPMTDTPVETHVVIDEGDGPHAVHFQEWWVRMGAAVPAERFVVVGMERAVAAPGVLDAIRSADLVLLPPSNPVVSIGIVLAVPGVRDALRGTGAPVVGVSPIIAGRPVRGYADACLQALGLETSATVVADLYSDFLNGWLVDEADAADVAQLASEKPDLTVQARPLVMRDIDAAAEIAGAAVTLGHQLATR